jgi:hypothetical protein
METRAECAFGFRSHAREYHRPSLGNASFTMRACCRASGYLSARHITLSIR